MCFADCFPPDDVLRVIDSISDNNAYLSFHVQPVCRIIALLQQHFDDRTPEGIYSLSLSGAADRKSHYGLGSMSGLYGYSNRFMGGGQKLTHDHTTQYHFALQSFLLWKEIMVHFNRLWMFSDHDMLMEPYRLTDTGMAWDMQHHACMHHGGGVHVLCMP